MKLSDRTKSGEEETFKRTLDLVMRPKDCTKSERSHRVVAFKQALVQAPGRNLLTRRKAAKEMEKTPLPPHSCIRVLPSSAHMRLNFLDIASC